MADQDMRKWALKGAEQRLVEIAEEAAQIYATFPELRDRGAAGALPGGKRGRASREAAENGQLRRRRRTMSREARKRISEAQKARWAKQKGDSAAQPPTPLKRPRKASRTK